MITLDEAFSVIKNEINRRNFGDADMARVAALDMVFSLEKFMENISQLPTLNSAGKTVLRDESGNVIGMQG